MIFCEDENTVATGRFANQDVLVAITKLVPPHGRAGSSLVFVCTLCPSTHRSRRSPEQWKPHLEISQK